MRVIQIRSIGRSCTVLALLAITAPSKAQSPSSAPAAPASAPAAWARASDGFRRWEALLVEGRLADAEAAARDALKVRPTDDEARYELGVTQFLRAIERLSQGLARFGARAHPIFRLGGFSTNWIRTADQPTPPTYEDVRGLAQQLLDDLTAAEATLAALGDAEVRLPLRFALIRLDLDGDGKAIDDEALWRVYAAAAPGLYLTAEQAALFFIAFDRADADWLRGYCHLLSGLLEFGLAYDERELFDCCGHLIFARVKTPRGDLAQGGDDGSGWEFGQFADLIAAIHLINFPLIEARGADGPAARTGQDRMKAALGHLESMIACSRSMWKRVLAETDDEREWIPGPKQTGVIPGVRVSAEIVKGWHEFLDEAESLLAGRKLIPFWRSDPRGVNLRRVFTEPTRFDLVLWVQGSAAAPYLEAGPVTTEETWRRLQIMFRGNFIGFAVWFN